MHMIYVYKKEMQLFVCMPIYVYKYKYGVLL